MPERSAHRAEPESERNAYADAFRHELVKKAIADLRDDVDDAELKARLDLAVCYGA